MDEAAKVYKFALDSKGVTPPKTNDLDVLSQMVGMIGTANTNSPRVALDTLVAPYLDQSQGLSAPCSAAGSCGPSRARPRAR